MSESYLNSSDLIIQNKSKFSKPNFSILLESHVVNLPILIVSLSPMLLTMGMKYYLVSVFISWILFSTFVQMYEKYYIKKHTDSNAIDEISEYLWINSFIDEVSYKANIENCPKVRITNNDTNIGIVGNKYSSTIIISQLYLDKLTRSEIKGILSHELGHLKKNHTSVKSFNYLFRTFLGETAILLTTICKGISVLTGLVPFFGWIFSLLTEIVILLLNLSFLSLTSILSLVDFCFGRIFEYRADSYSIILGHHDGLLDFLKKEMANEKRPFFNLYSHPSAKNRVKSLEKVIETSKL